MLNRREALRGVLVGVLGGPAAVAAALVAAERKRRAARQRREFYAGIIHYAGLNPPGVRIGPTPGVWFEYNNELWNTA